MSNKYKKGFTLVEVLIVIAILTFLAGVAMVALNTARNKATDTAIRSALAAIRAQAEVFYSDYGSYGGNYPEGRCPASTDTTAPGSMFYSTTIKNAMEKAGTLSDGTIVDRGTTNIPRFVVNHTWCAGDIANSDWAMGAVLKSDLTKVWCIDSKGAAKLETIAGGVSTVTGDLYVTGAISSRQCI